MGEMQRMCRVLLTLAPGALAAQQSAGAELWRLAATTVPVPTALATGGAAAFWNPAQPAGAAAERAAFALELIETAPTVGAQGLLIVTRARVPRVGRVGLVYGRMSIGDLVRTSDSPDPDPGGIPYYTETLGATWAASAGATTVGATLAYQDTRLDATRAARWTFDVGVRRGLGAGDALSLAAATHFFSRLAAGNPAQDAYAAVELRLWRGPLWDGGTTGALRARYGLTFAHGFTADHQFGAGFEVGPGFAADVVVVREGSYGDAGWRPIAGVRVAIGRYHVSFARDAAFNDVGAAYRVGLEGRLP
jgi:hypothetical protein